MGLVSPSPLVITHTRPGLATACVGVMTVHVVTPGHFHTLLQVLAVQLQSHQTVPPTLKMKIVSFRFRSV